MFRYCPSCGSQKIIFERNKRFSCPDCGFVYYHNTAAATALVISAGETAALLVRAKEPGKGKLDLPGGFVEPGEGALDGLRRECREELGWDPGPECSLFASFPNMYPYKTIVYNTCDLFFTVSVPDLTMRDFHLEKSEIEGIRFIKLSELNFDDLAFDSVRCAFRVFLDLKGGLKTAAHC
jgi:ADP-ribose pyrophosphatase YjhB (NUDIX family)